MVNKLIGCYVQRRLYEIEKQLDVSAIPVQISHKLVGEMDFAHFSWSQVFMLCDAIREYCETKGIW